MTTWTSVQSIAWLPITKVFFEIAEPIGDVNHIKHRTRRSRFEDTSLTFFKSDMQELSNCHKRPLYIPAYIQGVEFRRATVDTRFSLNVIPLYILETAGVSQYIIVKQPIQVLGLKVRLHSLWGT